MVRAPRGPARKSIYDPVHGTVVVEGVGLGLIGQPAFQRLWGIRQTGFAHLVFPGANHTRLEHSLGVYWVTRLMSERLGLAAIDALTVSVGGLLHDLGHGPYSHTLDPSMREVLGFGHERISRAWITGESLPEITAPAKAGAWSIPELLERAELVPRQVADLVDPPRSTDRKPLLRAMLHGAIDADRLDYLQRDAHYTGVAHGTIDAARLLDTVREHAGRLVFAEKGRNAVEGFLVGRALMYSAVYFHKTARAAEVMAQSALERLPGYPEVAPSMFSATDGEFFAFLSTASERGAEIVRRFRERQLFKQALGWRAMPPGLRLPFLKLLHDPRERRAMEDRLADSLGAPPGAVLLDLAGLGGPRPPRGRWSEIGILEGDRVTYPFRASGVWRYLAHRPPTLWPVSVYVDPRWRTEAERRLPRALRRAI